MFIGRERELAELNRLYAQGGFQMVVLYGRRRVGKTTLVSEFAKGKPALFFTAKVQSNTLNLQDFSAKVYEHFGLPTGLGSFSSWQEALSFAARTAGGEHTVFVFDEFPYAASRDESLVSTMQVAIDHDFASTNVMLILTGSNQGFMEEKVLGLPDPRGARADLGQKNPLFGRRTAQMRLEPFDYADAARMLPHSSTGDRVKYYACVGGTPYYLARIDEQQSFEENITRLYFSKSGLLYEEPMMLLRQELREPALYSSITGAIAGGANKPAEIADHVGEEKGTVSKYLATLCDLGFVRRRVPFGESEKSRRSLYELQDALFDFWYRFVRPYADSVERDAGELVAAQLLSGGVLDTYIGKRYEGICLEWLVRQAKAGALPITAMSFGSWWGTDKEKREQTDIDVIACDNIGKTILLGECKWCNKFDEGTTLNSLLAKHRLLPGYSEYWYALLTKAPLTQVSDVSAFGEHILVADAEDIYRDI